MARGPGFLPGETNSVNAAKKVSIKRAAVNVRDAEMLLLLNKFKSVTEIAAIVGISPQTVYRRLPIILDLKAKEMSKLIARETIMQLSRLDELLARAVTAFDASILPVVEITIKDEADGEGKGTGRKPRKTTTKTQRNQFGDVKFLTEARMLMAERRKILGLDDEDTKREILQKITFNEINVTNIAASDGMTLTMEETAEIAKIMGSLEIDPGGRPRALLPPPDAIEAEFTDDAEEARTEPITEEAE